MSILKEFKTIPELYNYLTNDYGKDPSKVVMRHKPEKEYVNISYQEMKRQTELFAYGLLSLQVKKGDNVAIISENRPEWIYSDMAILGIGAVNVPLYPSLTADTVEYTLNNSESVGLILSNKYQLKKYVAIREQLKTVKFVIILNEKDYDPSIKELHKFSEIQKLGEEYSKIHPGEFARLSKQVSENDLCTIIYTSGTTGVPKGVMLSHKNIVSNVNSCLGILPISNTDEFLSYLPLCHIFERMAGYYTGFATGGIFSFAQSIETVAQNLIEIKPTIVTSVPRLFERIYSKVIKNVESQPPGKQKIFNWAIGTGKKYMAAKKAGKMNPVLAVQHMIADALVCKKIREKTGGRLRFFVSGGAALPKELGEFFEAIGIIIIEGYGMTESSPVIACNRPDDYRFGSVGKPLPSVEVKIADDGEILAKGDNVMIGYYKMPEDTAETIKNGWLHTGDVGHMTKDGNIVITDRKKHLFKTSAGKYIAPTPIENLFLASKFIDQFVLIGDRRMFLSALIVPDYEALKEWADNGNINYDTVQDLLKKQEVVDLFDKELTKFQKALASFEKVRKFALLDKAFTLESGEMTPSLKIKRKVIEERYKELIEEMYNS
ncbi:MAG: long-chain fatty acid--CoA ligase [Ignavibacteriaceae bacterium]|nr:long-chain fatty acid--CoA ligase [Ignavibacteriaceae bacterium]